MTTTFQILHKSVLYPVSSEGRDQSRTVEEQTGVPALRDTIDLHAARRKMTQYRANAAEARPLFYPQTPASTAKAKAKAKTTLSASGGTQHALAQIPADDS